MGAAAGLLGVKRAQSEVDQEEGWSCCYGPAVVERGGAGGGAAATALLLAVEREGLEVELLLQTCCWLWRERGWKWGCCYRPAAGCGERRGWRWIR